MVGPFGDLTYAVHEIESACEIVLCMYFHELTAVALPRDPFGQCLIDGGRVENLHERHSMCSQIRTRHPYELLALDAGPHSPGSAPIDVNEREQ
jgi:hypothetical protein